MLKECIVEYVRNLASWQTPWGLKHKHRRRSDGAMDHTPARTQSNQNCKFTPATLCAHT